MKQRIYQLQAFLENIDSYRDKLLFVFIKPYWPRKIIPNHISYIRVVIGIALLIMLFFLGVKNKTLVMTLFSIGVITDFIDGPVARGINKVTEFGAALDPVADRILIIPIAVYALFSTHKWLLLALLITEILSAATSLYYKSKEVYLESNIFGKIKMVLLSTAFIAILITWPSAPAEMFIYLLWLSIPTAILASFVRILELKNKTNETQPKNI